MTTATDSISFTTFRNKQTGSLDFLSGSLAQIGSDFALA